MTISIGTEKMYQTNAGAIPSSTEGGFIGDDNSFAGSLGDDDLQYINVAKASKCCGDSDCKCTFACWVAFKVASEPKGKGFYEWLDGK